MQTQPAGWRRQAARDRNRDRESGQGRAEPPGTEARSAVSCGEETRFKEMIVSKKQKPAGGRGEEEEEEEEGGRRGRHRARGGRGRRAASEGGGDGGGGEEEESRRLRWKINQLEKEKLQLTSENNQQLCRLQAEVTLLRSSLERGEAQRAELQYQLTVSLRDAERVTELSRDNRTLTDRVVQLQQTAAELQKVVDLTRQAREEDQHALQQEVEERDGLIQNLNTENQRGHGLLQEQQEALQQAERRMKELQEERDKEAELNRLRADELKQLTEREERRRREEELSDQRIKSLQMNIEAERAAHLETKFNSEVIQLRVRDLEAAVALERSNQQEAQCSLELLRAQFREVERVYRLERERSDASERAQQRLQTEHEQHKADMTVALETERKMTSDLSEGLEEEKNHHGNTRSLLEQAAQRRSEAEDVLRVCVQQIRDTLQLHTHNNCTQPAQHDGKLSPSAEVLLLLRTTLSSYQHRLEDVDRQVRDLLCASEKLQEENQSLQQLTSDQRTQVQASQQAYIRREEEAARLRQESSDWSTRCEHLGAELQKEKEARTEDVQQMRDRHEAESTARLSSLYRLYQRLLAGCVLLDQPQSILGNFTWEELCDVISEQVDQLTSDLRTANDKVVHLQSVCDKKSVRVRQLRCSQECVLSRLEESVRRREEAWRSRHTHTARRLQLCRSQCDSLRDHAASLTSDLSWSRGESSSFLLACALLAGALSHAHRRLRSLSQQKTLLSRRLAEREGLEEEVRRLANALRGDEEEEQDRGGRRSRTAARRWRRSVTAVMAARRLSELGRKTTVLFQLERGGGLSVCVCGDTTTQEDQDQPITGKGRDEGREDVCARWLRSGRLSSIVLSAMSDLRGALTHTGSSPPLLVSAARSGLSRLLDHVLDQSGAASGRADEDSLRGSVNRPSPPQREDVKDLVSALQQHFLLFSQRLHSAEVERRGLRMEVANLKRGQQEREEPCSKVSVERFHSVCVELRDALSREQEAQSLIHTLQTHTQQQKERSLRILGNHLSEVQRERRRLEDELRDTARRLDCVVNCVRAAETSCTQVRESLVQSQRSVSAQPRPLPLPPELSGAESIMGAPEVAVCQSFLSSVSQLCHTCSSRVDWLEREVSAHRSHVTALRSELQDACLRDNLAFLPVAGFPESFPLADRETPKPIPLSDLSKDPEVCLRTAPSQINPTSSSPGSKPDMTEKKATKKKKNRGGRSQTDRREVLS